jgi:hypothetical protein
MFLGKYKRVSIRKMIVVAGQESLRKKMLVGVRSILLPTFEIISMLLFICKLAWLFFVP